MPTRLGSRPQVAALARTLVASDWNVGPVLRELLLSEHFFDDNVIGALVRSPADYVIGPNDVSLVVNGARQAARERDERLHGAAASGGSGQTGY